MIRVSCAVKTHSFQLAEQLARHSVLDQFYTIYHSKKNTVVARFNKRKDLENIPVEKVTTFPFLAPIKRLRNAPFEDNQLFDSLVARRLKSDNRFDVLIGWSGMSVKSFNTAKSLKKKVVLERGSSHIRFQYALLEEEYRKWGAVFPADNRLLNQEEEEYRLSDYITVPSNFVAESFVKNGIPESKLFVNNFGSGSLFTPSKPKREKFTILYVGTLSMRKGLPYLFEALNNLAIDPSNFDVWFIGHIDTEIKKLIPTYERANWKFFGHVGHHQLADLVSQCHVAVHPSLEEGLSMVIPQLMAAGTPVICTTNTGGADLIKDGESGFIIPIRSSQIITEKLTYLYENQPVLESIRAKALDHAALIGTWDKYGDRYVDFVKKII